MCSSDVPEEWQLAVSMKLTPSSKALATTERVSPGPRVHRWNRGLGSPKLMPPRRTFETSMPLHPSLAYSMAFLPFSRACDGSTVVPAAGRHLLVDAAPPGTVFLGHGLLAGGPKGGLVGTGQKLVVVPAIAKK